MTEPQRQTLGLTELLPYVKQAVTMRMQQVYADGVPLALVAARGGTLKGFVLDPRLMDSTRESDLAAHLRKLQQEPYLAALAFRSRTRTDDDKHVYEGVTICAMTANDLHVEHWFAKGRAVPNERNYAILENVQSWISNALAAVVR